MAISISVIAGQDKSKSSVSAKGTVQHIITEEEKNTFHLSDKKLKEAVKVYFGKKPKDVFLHSPTPWKDLYKTYNWSPVQMVLTVQSAKILSVKSKSPISKTQIFKNNSKKKDATFNVGISESVNNTASSSWNTGGVLSIGQMFKYEVGFLGTGGGGETSISYSQSWGVGGDRSKSITIGSNSEVTVMLGPGEGVQAILTASRSVMKVQIEYIAYLIGTTAVNYYPKFKNHHFWSLDINRVMSKAKIQNLIKSTETIELGYYSDSNIDVNDIETGVMKAAYSMADVPGIE